jgi:hypothetical protein
VPVHGLSLLKRCLCVSTLTRQGGPPSFARQLWQRSAPHTSMPEDKGAWRQSFMLVSNKCNFSVLMVLLALLLPSKPAQAAQYVHTSAGRALVTDGNLLSQTSTGSDDPWAAASNELHLVRAHALYTHLLASPWHVCVNDGVLATALPRVQGFSSHMHNEGTEGAANAMHTQQIAVRQEQTAGKGWRVAADILASGRATGAGGGVSTGARRAASRALLQTSSPPPPSPPSEWLITVQVQALC